MATKKLASIINSLLIMLIAVGCAHGPATTQRPPSTTAPSTAVTELIIRDPAGTVIAKGKLILPQSLPAEGGIFEGTWTLDSSTNDFPADATRSGSYTATISDGEAVIDLHPGTADHNVMLTGKRVNGILSGDCDICKFAGNKPIGTFTVGAAVGHGH